MFKQQVWMIAIAHWLGILSVALGSYMIWAGLASPLWIIPGFTGLLIGALIFSVVLHRYITHGTFETNRFWHYVMAGSSALVFQGSPHGWALTHMTHHAKSDTPGDPHLTSWRYFYNKQFKNVPMVHWRIRQMVKDPVLNFVHRYSLLISLGFMTTLLAISPRTLLFVYLVPLGLTHIVGALHQINGHSFGSPRNWPLLEWVFPACGEWSHKKHHDEQRSPQLGTKWWHLDYGWLFIKMIRTDK